MKSSLSQSHHSEKFERCKAFINSNFVQTSHKVQPTSPRPAITISRQPFSGSHHIASALSQQLPREKQLPNGEWALFDRRLVHKILEDHHLPQHLARYMPEDKDREFSGLINEILGLHPSLWELFHHTCDTILKLAGVGNVILIGRGSHILTRHLPHVLKVRIIAPFDQRLRQAAQQWDLPEDSARRRLQKEDKARAAYIHSHFNESVDDPLAYHLILNTGSLSPDSAASTIKEALLACHQQALDAQSSS